MTVQDVYKKFIQQLKLIYEEREAENIADWVFESVAGIKRSDRITNKQMELHEPLIDKLNDVLAKLMQHKPVQYVLQEAWFYKMKFYVNEHVLIPRPETEELVEWVTKEIRNNKLEIRNKKVEPPSPDSFRDHNSLLTILDIGTGSGCIAIALKKEIPNAEIVAIDVSEEALKVASENAEYHNAEIQFKQVNFLNVECWPSLESFKIIVSNPPYIPEIEKSKLDKNVVEHEPHLALFVKDNDPFIFYRSIIKFSETHLNKDGIIYVEVHEEFSEEVAALFNSNNFQTEIKKDIYGRERMIKAFR